MPARRGKAAFSLSGSYSFRKRGSTRTITPRRGCYRCGECLGAHAPIYVATPPVRTGSPPPTELPGESPEKTEIAARYDIMRHCVTFCCIGSARGKQTLALKLKHLSVPGGSKPGSGVGIHYSFDERVRAGKIKLPPLASPIPPVRPRYHLLPKDEIPYLEQSLRIESGSDYRHDEVVMRG